MLVTQKKENRKEKRDRKTKKEKDPGDTFSSFLLQKKVVILAF